MDLIKQNDNILLVWDSSFDLNKSAIDAEVLKSKYDATIRFENVQRININSYKDSTFTLIILKIEECFDITLLATLLKLLKPSGRISVTLNVNRTDIIECLKLAGFVNITIQKNDTVAEKPNYEVGSSAKLTFGKIKTENSKVANVWKLTNVDDDLINENDLIDEKDKVKPDPTNLKVCGTTGKRKACKDCSCGLAEELASEGKVQETAKSSCGSCYLGDAFRCASCPYLGMPAFKPGEKVQLLLEGDDLE